MKTSTTMPPFHAHLAQVICSQGHMIVFKHSVVLNGVKQRLKPAKMEKEGIGEAPQGCSLTRPPTQPRWLTNTTQYITT